jgi:hypothetical protein
MDISKLQNLVMLELSAENLRLQMDLEDAVNTAPNNAPFKTGAIKSHLEKIVLNELVASKFQSLFVNNKDTEKQQENG